MERTSQEIAAYPEPAGVDGLLASHRVKFFFGLAVLMAALGYFAFTAFQSATLYYYTVEELQQRGPVEDGRFVRVSGKLVPGSFFREPGSTQAHFAVTDGQITLRSVHDGVVPDLFFNEHSELILEGTYTPDGVFESENIIVRCPSKYVAEG